ncbi:MAG TPA: PilZ domain-containing protein [Alphaproteobacteria bacterium]|nr:PilZ domain-containing protein [Alphaproteobacteria bacterium]
MRGFLQQDSATPREHSRFFIDLRLSVKAETKLYGRTRDISETGLGATVAGEIKMGDVVELEFKLPGNTDPTVVSAELRYRQGFSYGFRFLNLTKQQREEVRRATRYLPMVR